MQKYNLKNNISLIRFFLIIGMLSGVSLLFASDLPATVDENLGDENSKDAPPVAYVDALIDPNIAVDDSYNTGYTFIAGSSGLPFSQDIEMVSYFNDQQSFEGSTFEVGVSYQASMTTTNFGNLYFNVIALGKPAESDSLANSVLAYRKPEEGIRRVSFAQLGMPLTETLTFDNVLGVQRLSSGQGIRRSGSLINQRFTSAEPLMLGLSSRIYSESNEIVVSTGRLGESRGGLLPGYKQTGGRATQFSFSHASDNYIVTANHWYSNPFLTPDKNEDISGTKVSLTNYISEDLQTTITLAKSGKSTAALFGINQEFSIFQHDIGLYYFEEDFIWIDTLIGSGYKGAYYRFRNQYKSFRYGGSAEYRQDGFSTEAIRSIDTFFTSLYASYRLNRRDNINTSYNFRTVKNNVSKVESMQHSLKLNYSHQFSGQASANFGTTMRLQEDSREQRYYYRMTYDTNNDNYFEVDLEYSQQSSNEVDNDSYHLSGNWRKPLYGLGDLSLGLGYRYQGEAVGSTSNNWDGFINYDWPINARWSISAQIDYSQEYYEIKNNNLSDNLFTGPQFDEFEENDTRQLSAYFTVSYSLGARDKPATRLAQQGRNGSGNIEGHLFIDENGDGIFQNHEAGLPGVTVFLDNAYTALTDENGLYQFLNIGTGNHQIFVDEMVLPLPWSLYGEEYRLATVTIRATAKVNIPVREI